MYVRVQVVDIQDGAKSTYIASSVQEILRLRHYKSHSTHWVENWMGRQASARVPKKIKTLCRESNHNTYIVPVS